jgi:hypothetical protein
VIPGVLAGMPMLFVHPERRLIPGGPLKASEDEWPDLYALGIRGVVSLLNIPSEQAVFESVGFSFLCLPVPDGGAPTIDQANEFVHFVERHRQARYGALVLMSAELEFAAWSTEGSKLWSTFVAPPWDYPVVGESVTLNVMGKKCTFHLRQGPENKTV